MSILVNWYFDVYDPSNKFLDLINNIRSNNTLPDRIAKEFQKTRKLSHFSVCPAHTDFIKNIFIIRSPIDLEFDYSYPKGIITKDIELARLMFDVRFNVDSLYPQIELNLQHYFISDSSCEVIALPAFMHYNNFTNNATVIPGKFDIGKWVRPISCSFELKTKEGSVSIKKGDALFYIKFNTHNAVKLEKIKETSKELEKLNKLRYACIDLKSKNSMQPLSKRYQSLTKILPTLFK